MKTTFSYLIGITIQARAGNELPAVGPLIAVAFRNKSTMYYVQVDYRLDEDPKITRRWSLHQPEMCTIYLWVCVDRPPRTLSWHWYFGDPR